MLKNIAILASGSAFSQLVAILFSPVLSRIYTPEDFGVYGTFLSITGVICAASSLKYDLAFIVEKDEKKAEVLYAISFYVLTLMTMLGILLSLIIFYVFGDLLPSYVNYLLILLGGLVVFFTGYNGILTAKLTKFNKFMYCTNSRMIQTIVALITQIVFGLIGIKYYGLVLGSILSLILSIVYIYLAKLHKLNLFIPNKDLILSSLLEYKNFPLYTASQSILSNLSINAPIFILTPFFGAGTVGSFWLAKRVLIIPTVLIGEAVRQALFKEAAEFRSDPIKLKKLFFGTTKYLFLIIIIPTVFMFFFSPFLFAKIFGQNWTDAGLIAKWLSLYMAATFINTPSTICCQVLNKNKWHFNFEIMQTIVRFVSLFIPALLGMNFIKVIASYSLASLTMNLIYVCFVYFRLFPPEKPLTR